MRAVTGRTTKNGTQFFMQLKRDLKKKYIYICLSPCHSHRPWYKIKLSELHFPALKYYKHGQRSGVQYMYNGFSDTYTGIGSTVKSISNLEHTAFPLIFQIQWKHPHDSLPCLILNTFPLSWSSQRDVYEKP